MVNDTMARMNLTYQGFCADKNRIVETDQNEPVAPKEIYITNW